jgi:hypothetical protein
MQLFFVAELHPIGARSCHGAAPVRILASTIEIGGKVDDRDLFRAGVKDISLFFGRTTSLK